MSLSLLDIPHDLLLDIAARIDFEDVFSLVSTCTSLRKLYHSRSLWISTLHRVQQQRRLACPSSLPLLHASLRTLKRIAGHTYRLKRNLDCTNPKLKRALRAKFVTSERMNVVSVVPGTGTILLYTQQSEKLIVCDLDQRNGVEEVLLETAVGGTLVESYLATYEGNYVLTLITHLEEVGLELHVISLSFHDGKPTNLETLCTSELVENHPRRIVTFMSEGLVGIITDTKDDENTGLPIQVVDYKTGSTAKIYIDFGYPLPDNDFVSYTIYDHQVFVIESTSANHKVSSFPTSIISTAFSLPSPSSISMDISIREHLYVEIPEEGESGRGTRSAHWCKHGLILADVVEPASFVGTTVAQVSLWPLDPEYSQVCYQSSSSPSASASPASSTTSLLSSDSFATALSTQLPSIPPSLEFDTSSLHPQVRFDISPVIHTIPGRIIEDPDSPESKLLGVVGQAYAILLLDTQGDMPTEMGGDDDTSMSLHLVRYSHDSGVYRHLKERKEGGEQAGQISSVKLDVPPFIKLENVCSIRMDEGFGVVYMVDYNGWVWALNYA